MKAERGGALLLFVLWLPVLLLAFGLALDYGLYLVERQRLQQVAEAAALAGVRRVDFTALAQGSPALRLPEAEATAYAFASGASRGQIRVEGWQGAEPGLRVSLRQTWRPPFSGWALGNRQIEVRAAAALVAQKTKID